VIALALLFALAADPDDGPWVNPPTSPTAGVEHHTFRSAAMNRDVGFSIYLPPQYWTEPRRRFPVIYYLHGRTDDETKHIGNVDVMDRAIRAGDVPPVLYVYAYGGRQSFFTETVDGRVKPKR
jgi:enterochelin esterase-like enzyme